MAVRCVLALLCYLAVFCAVLCLLCLCCSVDPLSPLARPLYGLGEEGRGVLGVASGIGEW